MYIFLRKFISFTKLIFSKFLIIFFSPISLAIILVSPFYLIRLGFISSSRVGTFLYVSEIFIAEKIDKINQHDQMGIDIFYFDKVISNKLIAKKCNQKINNKASLENIEYNPSNPAYNSNPPKIFPSR